MSADFDILSTDESNDSESTTDSPYFSSSSSMPFNPYFVKSKILALSININWIKSTQTFHT